MTSEQREAIEDVEEFNNKFDCGKYKKSIDTVLSLIKQKDKQIDLMAEYISKYHCFEIIVYDLDDECKHEHECKDCIKQYFEKLAKEKGE